MAKRRHIGDALHCKSLGKLFSTHKLRAAQHGLSIDYTAHDLLNLALSTSHCPYCGDPLKPKHMQYDHIKPLSRGGSASITNMQVLCARCNRRKSYLDSTEYEMLLVKLDEIVAAVGDSAVKCKVLKALASCRF